MITQTLPINEIKVEDRQRKDLGDLSGLADSLQRIGLIQPVIVNKDRRLVAGGRRVAAANQLGWTHIPVAYRETLSEAELHELELEENKNRKDFTWQEECLLIEKIHNAKVSSAALNSHPWGLRASATLFSIDIATISYTLRLAKEIRIDSEGPVAKAENPTEAWKVVMRREQDAANAELAARQSVQTASAMEHDVSSFLETLPDPVEVARERYLSNPLNNPNGFDQYWKERQEWIDKKDRVIFLTSSVVKGDAIEFMKNNPDRFDHIITDPPYAIEMSNLDQDQGGIDTSVVEAEHEVEPNLDLLAKFFPVAFETLKESGYCILWCDQMIWQFLYEKATAAGFKVQRWPITWVKTHTCMNQMAKFNFTKSTEIAMVCRKGQAVLAEHQSNCHILASHDEYKDQLAHPFVKPFEAWKRLIEAVSHPHQLILEPFAGRGSGVLSILRTNRNAVAVECNEAHYNALLENVKKYYLEINPQYVFV